MAHRAERADLRLPACVTARARFPEAVVAAAEQTLLCHLEGAGMVFRVLADLVVVTHFCLIIFIAVGGLLAWRWPRLFWLHLPAFIYGTVIITVGFTCPLTPLEKYLRRLGQQKAYRGGFVDHYISGVIYPEKLTWLVQSLVATAVVIGYVGLTRTTKRRRASAKVEGTAAYPNRHESAEPEDSLEGRCRRAPLAADTGRFRASREREG